MDTHRDPPPSRARCAAKPSRAPTHRPRRAGPPCPDAPGAHKGPLRAAPCAVARVGLGTACIAPAAPLASRHTPRLPPPASCRHRPSHPAATHPGAALSPPPSPSRVESLLDTAAPHEPGPDAPAACVAAHTIMRNRRARRGRGRAWTLTVACVASCVATVHGPWSARVPASQSTTVDAAEAASTPARLCAACVRRRATAVPSSPTVGVVLHCADVSLRHGATCASPGHCVGYPPAVFRRTTRTPSAPQRHPSARAT